MKFNLNYNIISIIVISKAYVYGIPSYLPPYVSPSNVSPTKETSITLPTPAGSGNGVVPAITRTPTKCRPAITRTPTKCYPAVPPPPPPPVKCRPALVFSTTTIQPIITPKPTTTSKAPKPTATTKKPEPTISIPRPDPISIPRPDPVIECYLRLHNGARKEVGLPPLTWDPKLAISATAYSNVLYNRSPRGIALKHSDLDVGENLYAHSSQATCEKGMKGWLDEKPLYRPGSSVGTGDFHGYGHYSQIVNRDVTKVGCGVDSAKGKYLTCHYDRVQQYGKSAY
jgi:uncharacterized protein YkwD